MLKAARANPYSNIELLKSIASRNWALFANRTAPASIVWIATVGERHQFYNVEPALTGDLLRKPYEKPARSSKSSTMDAGASSMVSDQHHPTRSS